MIAQSQSGTGKTAAFALAVLSRVDVKNQFPQVNALYQSMSLYISCSLCRFVFEFIRYLSEKEVLSAL